MMHQCEICMKWVGKVYERWSGSAAFGSWTHRCFDCLSAHDQEEIRNTVTLKQEASWLLFGME